MSFTPDGSNRQCADVPITNDDTLEQRENFIVIFTPDVPEAQASTSTVNIDDDDQIGILKTRKHVHSKHYVHFLCMYIEKYHLSFLKVLLSTTL